MAVCGTDLERHVGAIDVVIRAVFERRPPSRPRDSSAIGPLVNSERKPFSTGGMYCLGTRPPTTFSSNMKFSSASSGSDSRRPTMWAYWPEPPVCLRCLMLNSAACVGASR